MKNIIWNNTWKQWISQDGRFTILHPVRGIGNGGLWVSIDKGINKDRHEVARDNTVAEARQRCERILASD